MAINDGVLNNVWRIIPQDVCRAVNLRGRHQATAWKFWVKEKMRGWKDELSKLSMLFRVCLQEVTCDADSVAERFCVLLIWIYSHDSQVFFLWIPCNWVFCYYFVLHSTSLLPLCRSCCLKSLLRVFIRSFPTINERTLFQKQSDNGPLKTKCGSCGGDRMTNKYEQRLLEAFSFAFTKSLSSSMKFLGLLVQCCQAYSLNSLEQTALMTVKSVMEVHLRWGGRKECNSRWSKFTHTGLEMCSHKFCKWCHWGSKPSANFRRLSAPFASGLPFSQLTFNCKKKYGAEPQLRRSSFGSSGGRQLRWLADMADMAAQRKGVTHMGFCCKLEEFRNGSQLIWRLGPVHNLQLLLTSDGRTLWDTARGAKLFFEMPPFAGETLAWRGRLVQASVHTTSFETAFRSEYFPGTAW